jgi:endoglucanase
MGGHLRAFLVTLAMSAATPQLLPAQYLRGVNVTGAEWGNKTIPGANGEEYLYPSQQTFEYFAARGFNFIRLTNLWERLQPTPGGPLDPTVLGYLKQNVAWAKAAGIKVSIEIHNFGRYTIPGSVCSGQDPWGIMPAACIIDNKYNGNVLVSGADLADFWRRMSDEFKGDSTVMAYDLMNEPHDMGTADWKQITQDVLTAIRNNDDSKLIMIPGDGGSNATSWPSNHGSASWINDPQNNFWYEAHEYFDYDYSGTYAAARTINGVDVTYPSSYDLNLAANSDLLNVGVNRLQPFLGWCQANNVKGYLGEFGVPRDEPRWLPVLERLLEKLDEAGMAGSYWSAGDAWNWASSDKLNVQPENGFTTDREQMPTLLAHLAPDMFRTDSAAGPYGYALAPGSLVAGFGQDLAVSTRSAAGSSLPTTLLGTQIQLTDSQNSTTFAPLLYVSPERLYYQVPSSTAPGRVDVQVIKSGTTVASGVLEVQTLAPVIITANGGASGVASAQIRRVKPDGRTTYEPVATYDASEREYVAIPIRFDSDSLSLILYGTGFSQLPGTSAASVSINGTPVSVTSAGSTGLYPGLDQITVTLPSSLAGSGSVTVQSTLGGIAANVVTVSFQ